MQRYLKLVMEDLTIIEKKTSKQQCYISRMVQDFLLSFSTCMDLGLCHSTYPEVGSCETLTSPGPSSKSNSDMEYNNKEVLARMQRTDDGYQCPDCKFKNNQKADLYLHIEAWHVNCGQWMCSDPDCKKFMCTFASTFKGLNSGKKIVTASCGGWSQAACPHRGRETFRS